MFIVLRLLPVVFSMPGCWALPCFFVSVLLVLMWLHWCFRSFLCQCLLVDKDINYANMGSWLHLSFLGEVAVSLVAPCSFCLCLFLNDIKKQLFQGLPLIKGAPVSRVCLLYLVVSYFLWLHFVFWRGCNLIWRCKHVNCCRRKNLFADLSRVLSHPTIHKHARPTP